SRGHHPGTTSGPARCRRPGRGKRTVAAALTALPWRNRRRTVSRIPARAVRWYSPGPGASFAAKSNSAYSWFLSRRIGFGHVVLAALHAELRAKHDGLDQARETIIVLLQLVHHFFDERPVRKLEGSPQGEAEQLLAQGMGEFVLALR